MIKVFGSTRGIDDIEESRIDRRINEMFDGAKADNVLDIVELLKAFGEDGRSRKALINLLDVASRDAPVCMAQGVLKTEALAELVDAFDEFHRGELEE